MSKETVHLAVYDTLADWEIGYVIGHLNSPECQKKPGRFEIKTVGDSLDPVISKGGLTIVPDLSLDTLDPGNSRMLILPGADSALNGGIDRFVDAASLFLSAGIPVAAICGATAALAKGGLLDESLHTSNAKVFLEMTGYRGSAYYQEQPAVTDGNLITAGGVAPIEFAIEIFRKLDVYSDTTLNAWCRLYQDHNPQGFFDMMAEQNNE